MNFPRLFKRFILFNLFALSLVAGTTWLALKPPKAAANALYQQCDDDGTWLCYQVQVATHLYVTACIRVTPPK